MLSARKSRGPDVQGPDEPLAVADGLSLDEEGLALDLDPVAGARRWHLGHAQVDAGGFGPEPRIAVVCDGIGTPCNNAHESGCAAIGNCGLTKRHWSAELSEAPRV